MKMNVDKYGFPNTPTSDEWWNAMIEQSEEGGLHYIMKRVASHRSKARKALLERYPTAENIQLSCRMRAEESDLRLMKEAGIPLVTVSDYSKGIRREIILDW